MASQAIKYCPYCRRHRQDGLEICPADGAPLLTIDERPLERGAVIDDRFVLLENVGKGGMSSVFRATDRLRGMECAVKLLKRSCCRDIYSISQFFTEARTARKLNHPGIIKVFAFGSTVQGRPWMAMELLNGRTLADLLAEKSRLPLAEAGGIILELLDGLAYAHAHSVIHKDLKPENIYLENRDDGGRRVKLLDFGIAEAMGRCAVKDGEICGTPTYMSPEQIRSRPLGPTSDIYSAGAVFFEMLCGRPPFEGSKPTDVLSAHLKMRPPRVSSLVGEADRLDILVARMLAKEPSRRPESAGRIILELSEALGLQPPPSPKTVPKTAPPSPNVEPGSPVCVYVKSEDDMGQAMFCAANPADIRPYVDLHHRPSLLEWELDEEFSQKIPSIHHGMAIALDERLSATAAFLAENGLAAMSHRAKGLLLLHVGLVRTGEAAQLEVEDLRARMQQALERMFSALEVEGFLVFDDRGDRLRLILDPGLFPEVRDAVRSAVRAALTISQSIPEAARAAGLDCNVRLGLSTGSVYCASNEESALVEAISGSALEIAERLSDLALPGALVMDGRSASLLGWDVEMMSLGDLKERGGGTVGAKLFLGAIVEREEVRRSPEAPQMPERQRIRIHVA